MQHVLIIHEVAAYPAWKAVFDQAADIRKRAGEVSYLLLRYDNDENTIVHFSEWSSLDNARRFFESPKLVEIRKKAGVKASNFLYLQEIERGVLKPEHGVPEMKPGREPSRGRDCHMSPIFHSSSEKGCT